MQGLMKLGLLQGTKEVRLLIRVKSISERMVAVSSTDSMEEFDWRLGAVPQRTNPLEKMNSVVGAFYNVLCLNFNNWEKICLLRGAVSDIFITCSRHLCRRKITLYLLEELSWSLFQHI